MSGPAGALEARVARVLTRVTYVGVAIIGVGTALMVVRGVSPLDAPPPLSLGALAAALGALRPEGFLWLGIVVLVAGPILRVVSSGIGYLGGGERRMVLISLGILAVIAASVVVGLAAAASAAG